MQKREEENNESRVVDIGDKGPYVRKRKQTCRQQKRANGTEGILSRCVDCESISPTQGIHTPKCVD